MIITWFYFKCKKYGDRIVAFYEKKNVLYRVKSVDVDNTMKEIEAIIND